MSQQFSAVRLILAAKAAQMGGDLAAAHHLISKLPGQAAPRILNQRQKRKNRRRAHAAGDPKAFC